MALRLHNRRRYPYVLLAVFSAAIALCFLFGSKGHLELLAPILGAVTAFAYFLYNQHREETRLFKELFIAFNARYDNLNHALNAIISTPSRESLTPEQRDDLFNYFNLCAEEYFFYNAGYIDSDVWASWCRGMSVFFKHPPIRALWELDCEAGSYYGFRPPLGTAPTSDRDD